MTDEIHPPAVAPATIVIPRNIFPDDQGVVSPHGNIFNAIAERDGAIGMIKRDTKFRTKNPEWAYKIAMSDDETPESAVKLFGRPEGTPVHEGKTHEGARIFAVWMNDRSAPTEDPEF